MTLLQSVSGLQMQLQNYLGTKKYEEYLENIRDWFGERVTKDFFDFQLSLILDEKGLEIHNEMMRLLIYYCNNDESESINSTNLEGTTTMTIVCKEEKITMPTTDDHHHDNNSVDDITASCTLQDGKYVVNTNQFIVASSMNQEGHNFGTSEPEYITVNFVDSEGMQEESQPINNYYNSSSSSLGGAGNYTHNNTELLAIEYPSCSSSLVRQVESPSPPVVDWLFDVLDVRPELENFETIPAAIAENRFPTDFTTDVILAEKREVIPNFTHGADISDHLRKYPHLRKHFGNPVLLNGKPVFLPAGSSIHGQFLLKAWENRIETVDINATILAIDGVKDHICSVVKALIKQRRAFRIRNRKISHSIGSPYPNPYLRQVQKILDDPYRPDTAQLADAMHIPSLLSINEEKERLSALRLASYVGSKTDFRYSSSRITSADLIDLLETNPSVIPKNSSRLKMQEIARQNYKGYAGNFHSDAYNDDERSILPLCSY